MKMVFLWLGVAAMALAMEACSTQRKPLEPGMTPGQAVAAMGEPDLKDTLTPAGKSGPAMLRYTWLGAGQSAVFGPDNRIAEIQRLGPATTQASAETEPSGPPAPSNFDPIQTPLDYAFYPFRLGAIYLGAGLNCLGGGSCQKPKLPSPSNG
jgi:hypothetical protein